ncbi:DMT family transporter [Peribacillus sp. SCS-37]|uniref:DMT family transporter n=1 Tax=Paraperibacillus esterisolvens TaxID=3115296 RepID=UPI003905770F
MSRKNIVLLLSLAALWGASFLFIRIAAPEFGPFLTVELRVAIASIVLLGYASIVRSRFSFREHWKEYLMAGALNAAIPFALITIAELHLTASTASIINATTPMFTALTAWIWFKHHLSMKKWGGMLLGLAGVAILTGWSANLGLPFLLASLSSLGAALFYGIAGNYIVKALPGVKPLQLAIGQQIGASLVLLPFALANLPHSAPSLPSIFSVAALAVFCTSLAYLLFFQLLAAAGAVKTASVTFLVPIFGIIWGTLFLDEQIHFTTSLGMVIIFISIILVTDLKWGRVKQSANKSA